MNKTTTYYQPYMIEDGETILPEELASFQAFRSKDACDQWLENMGYDWDDWSLKEYHDEDIEGVTILNGDGNPIEINGDGENDICRWCSDDYHDAYTDLGNFLYLMEKALGEEEFHKVTKKMADYMIENKMF